jgi:dienelactone hydrolase
LLFDACVAPRALGSDWPEGVPLQIHGMDADEVFVGDGDLEAARTLVSSVAVAELFLYPGRGHIFADSSLSSYDELAARLLTERVIQFLQRR